MSELTPMSYGRIVRPSIAHTIDKVNEVVDWINNSEIKSTKLVETGEGTEIQVGKATQLSSLEMEGLAIQDGTPTPDNPVPIQVVRGRNLYNDDASTLNKYVKEDGSIGEVADGSVSLSEKIAVKPGTSYTISGETTVGDVTRNVIFDANGAVLAAYTLANRTFTTPSNASYMLMSVASADRATLQLELGSTPTPYVPYGHVGLEVRDSSDELVSVTPIPLPSKGFAAALPDGTCDALAIDSAGGVEWTNASGRVVVDGSAKTVWGLSTIRGRVHALVETGAGTMPNAPATVLTMCDRLPGISGNAEYSGTTGIGAANDRFLRFLCDDIQSFTTNAEANTWLQSHPLTVYYKTAAPTTEHAYIDLPTIPDGAKLRILATLEPGFSAGWFTEDALPMVVNALNARIESMGNSEQVGALGSTRDHLEILDTPLKIGNELKPVEKQTEEQEEQEELEETEEK